MMGLRDCFEGRLEDGFVAYRTLRLYFSGRKISLDLILVGELRSVVSGWTRFHSLSIKAPLVPVYLRLSLP
jgi:hypothetical protein